MMGNVNKKTLTVGDSHWMTGINQIVALY